jgi:hypothetical protein
VDVVKGIKFVSIISIHLQWRYNDIFLNCKGIFRIVELVVELVVVVVVLQLKASLPSED